MHWSFCLCLLSAPERARRELLIINTFLYTSLFQEVVRYIISTSGFQPPSPPPPSPW